MFRTSVTAAVVLCSTLASAEEASPPAATYVLRSRADRCDPDAVADPFQYAARGSRCAVAWNGGRTEWFDAVFSVRAVVDEGPRLRQTTVPLYVARQGREWYFGRGASKGAPLHDVWEYRNVVGVRYWTAHALTGFRRLAAESSGWMVESIDGPVRLHQGLPYFVLPTPRGSMVRWSEYASGPYPDLEDVASTGDALLLALRGQTDPVPFRPDLE